MERLPWALPTTPQRARIAATGIGVLFGPEITRALKIRLLQGTLKPRQFDPASFIDSRKSRLG